MGAVARRIVAAGQFWYLFIRLPLIGFTLMLPLVGALASGVHPTPVQAAILLLAGLVFHCFAYVLNDVVDLPLDRTESLRADFPLVRGTISKSAALAFALVQAPLALGLTALLGGGAAAYAALAAAYALIAVYNLWGKRTAFPPLIDFIQGIGWAAMVSYGAAIVGDAWARPALVCAAFVTLYITLLNGVHGGMRDLENDLRCGARTTAIALGAHPDGRGGATLTPALAVYALAVQALICALMLVQLYAGWYGYGAGGQQVVAVLVSVLVLAALAMLAAIPWLLADRWAMIYAGSWHLLLLLTGLVALVAPLARPWLLAIVIVTHLLPLLVNFWLYRSVARWVRSLVHRKEAHDGAGVVAAAGPRVGADHAD